MADVFCAGIIVVDHVAAPVDHLPAAGELVLTEECMLAIGGCSSNVAVDLRKMEVSVALGGLVGADPLGDFALSTLRGAGVDVAAVASTTAAATSQTLILNVKGQDRRFVHHVGCNRLIDAAAFPAGRIAECKILYVGGFFLMGMSGTDLAALFRQARAAGVKTVLDVVTPAGGADHLAALAPALPFTDVFLPNTDEARVITGLASPLEQAEKFRALGAETVVITSGGDGAVLVSPSERLKAGVFPTSFVDATGGGDAFDAGYICGLLEGAPARRCLELGSALGASCVRKTGATAGVFTRAEADRFLAEHRLPVEMF
ncbi:MAG TPA: carbohydrate kinase family protein [Planctomycetia bacterium]|nr:carbohydrate kinase family protein [Planctomycetia bacterium]